MIIIKMMKMLTAETLNEKWNSILQYEGGYTRIDPVHPLEFNIGFEEINHRALLLISDFEPKTIESSKSISITIGKRQDEKWAICFRLVKKEQESVFLHFCCDLIESSRSQSNNQSGLFFVLDRYKQWHRLLEYQVEGLSETVKKGLLGEVIFMQNLLKFNQDLLQVVRGWVGPEGSDRDFIYEDIWYEVKAEGIASKTVKISSLEQLDVKQYGQLIICLIDKTTSNELNSFSLKGKLDEINNYLIKVQDAYKLFNSKLLKIGYIELKEYSEQFYTFSGFKRYLIDSAFPRLIKDSIPSQIISASYDISLSAIENWRINKRQ